MWMTIYMLSRGIPSILLSHRTVVDYFSSDDLWY